MRERTASGRNLQRLWDQGSRLVARKKIGGDEKKVIMAESRGGESSRKSISQRGGCAKREDKILMNHPVEGGGKVREAACTKKEVFR